MSLTSASHDEPGVRRERPGRANCDVLHAPSVPGVLYWTHSPLRVMTAWPARTSIHAALVLHLQRTFQHIGVLIKLRCLPRFTPNPMDCACAQCSRRRSWEFTRPINSSMSFRFVTRRVMRVGFQQALACAWAFYNTPITLSLALRGRQWRGRLTLFRRRQTFATVQEVHHRVFKPTLPCIIRTPNGQYRQR